MNLSERCNYLEITLNKPVLDNNYKTRVVFDSTKAQLVEDSNSPETGYFALDIYKDNICLTQVQGGVETVIYGRSESSKRVIKDILKTSDYIEEGENAALKISTQKVGDYVVCVVKINDKAAINTMCRAHNSEETGFWGVCSQKAPLELTY